MLRHSATLALLLAVLGLLLACSGAEASSPSSPRARLVLTEDGLSSTRTFRLPPQVNLPHNWLHAHSPMLGRDSLYANLGNANAAIAARAQQSLNCSVCESLVTMLKPLIFEDSTRAWMVEAANFVCREIKPLCKGASQCAEVCSGIIHAHEDIFFDILREIVTPAGVCAALKQCPPVPTPSPSTLIPVPSDLSDLRGEVAWPSWQLAKGAGHFAHLSDGHIDRKYTVGMNTDCGLPLCCHASDGPGKDASTSAGYWGDYQCDTPPQLADSLVQHLASLDPPLDFVLYTGDDPSHDVWRQNREGNIAALWDWSSYLNSSLGVLGVPVFHTLGNHEIHPVNQFAGPEHDAWLYEEAVKAWAPFLPLDAQRTMRYGGYYQARVRPGLRVISLNSNYFTNDNFWLLANQTAAETQLNWAADVLRQASLRGEKAIVICHAPILKWNTRLASAWLKIADQYASVIVNYFMGHTHLNQYATLRGASGKPQHVLYVGGSVAPFTDVNPGFMRYEYSRATLASGLATKLVDQAYAHWVDLDLANALNDTDAQWKPVRYNMSAALGVELDAASLHALAPSYLTDAALYASYTRALTKGNVRSSMPSAQAVACATASNTDEELHACMHAAGSDEEDIESMEAIEGRCDDMSPKFKNKKKL